MGSLLSDRRLRRHRSAGLLTRGKAPLQASGWAREKGWPRAIRWPRASQAKGWSPRGCRRASAMPPGCASRVTARVCSGRWAPRRPWQGSRPSVGSTPAVAVGRRPRPAPRWRRRPRRRSAAAPAGGPSGRRLRPLSHSAPATAEASGAARQMSGRPTAGPSGDRAALGQASPSPVGPCGNTTPWEPEVGSSPCHSDPRVRASCSRAWLSRAPMVRSETPSSRAISRLL